MFVAFRDRLYSFPQKAPSEVCIRKRMMRRDKMLTANTAVTGQEHSMAMQHVVWCPTKWCLPSWGESGSGPHLILRVTVRVSASHSALAMYPVFSVLRLFMCVHACLHMTDGEQTKRVGRRGEEEPGSANSICLVSPLAAATTVSGTSPPLVFPKWPRLELDESSPASHQQQQTGRA